MVRHRPPQDVDVLAVLDFEIPCLRPEIPALYQKLAYQPKRAWTKTRTSATTLGTGTRASKIKDGEDVDVLRTPGKAYEDAFVIFLRTINRYSA